MIEATDGIMRYKNNLKGIGADITTKEGIINFRKTLGTCPQNDSILFENLNVDENLEILCLFKYDKSKKEKNDIGIKVKDLLK